MMRSPHTGETYAVAFLAGPVENEETCHAVAPGAILPTSRFLVPPPRPPEPPLPPDPFSDHRRRHLRELRKQPADLRLHHIDNRTR